MTRMAPNSQRGVKWLGKRQRARSVPRSQESLRVKDLTEQSGENWLPVRARRGHEGDKTRRAGGELDNRRLRVVMKAKSSQ